MRMGWMDRTMCVWAPFPSTDLIGPQKCECIESRRLSAVSSAAEVPAVVLTRAGAARDDETVRCRPCFSVLDFPFILLR